ncbi:MAG: glycosyltransferase family 9 protein [Nitrospinaceae bacterium]
MNKVLIVSSTGMGDCLWGTPGIRALKKTFPEVKIDLIVNRVSKPLFEFNPYLNKIFEYQEQWYRQPLIGIQLFGRHYDAIFIFHANRNFKRTLPWFRSSPIWCHQNFDWISESHRMKFNYPIHGIQRRLVMLEQIDVKPDGGQMEIFFNQSALDKSQKIKEAEGINPGKYVYLNLGAAVESRRWVVDRFMELARLILKKTSWKIILGGGPAEKKQACTIVNQLNTSRVAEVCDQPLVVDASIISRAGLMVTANTGPMHIGLAMKTPVVALFGTYCPISAGPFEIPDHLCRIIKIDLEGKDHIKKSDPGEFQLKSITVGKVWEQVEKMLREKSNP